MEHVNATATATARQQQQQQQQQHLQFQQHQQEQQQQHENQQQFCLRWNNHQTSLLSTLPVLLDQSHLTDVTISAEGRTLRAHRVVLSACSGFFMELFRALDASNHPVIVIPGASFAAIVALLTFMYSGEVNVYEEQIPMLLNLAETLGIKGLADVQNNLQKSTKRHASDYPDSSGVHKTEPETTPTSTPTPPPAPLTPPPLMPTSTPTTTTTTATTNLLNPPNVPLQLQPTLPTPLSPMGLHSALSVPFLSGANKLPPPLESYFLKSLQYYPNLLSQPLNFSQTALNKTSELLAKYQQQCNNLYQGAGVAALGLTAAAKDLLPQLANRGEEYVEDSMGAKRLCMTETKQLANNSQQQQQQQQQQQKDIKRIDRIVESLRCSNKTTGSGIENSPSNGTLTMPTHIQTQMPLTSSSLKCNTANNIYPTPPSSHLHNAVKSNAMMYGNVGALQLQQQQAQSQQQQQQQQQQQAQHIPESYAGCSRDVSNNVATANRNTPVESSTLKGETMCVGPEKRLPTSSPVNAQGKPISNSKLYATCFICHKQLSNQYNLRVHLETHQNVRYACNVCSHVSRSKDALRKHVSYRHPGAPSPCETEARRKRACKGFSNTSSPTSAVAVTTPNSSGTPPPPTAMNNPFRLANSGSAAGGSNANALEGETQMPTAAQLSSAYMLLPNQFHLAAAAAAAAQQQQQQQQHQQRQQQQQQLQKTIMSDFVNTSDVSGNLTKTTTTNNTVTSVVSTTATTTTTLATTAGASEVASPTALAAAVMLNNFNVKPEPDAFVGTATTITNDVGVGLDGAVNNSGNSANVNANVNNSNSPTVET